MTNPSTPPAVVVADADTEHRKRVVALIERVSEKLQRPFEVCEAADGNALEELIDEKDPVMIVSEVLLDHVSGLQLLRKLRQAEDEERRIWVFVTHMNQESDKYWALRNGVDAYVMRPYQDESLENRLIKLLAGEADTSGRERSG